ncbi:MAG: class I SAM-dependent methyltransferase [Acidobacteriota bacterium]|nr:class I SAM-dependent methyltransferase [Acidobacteriota bacterium]
MVDAEFGKTRNFDAAAAEWDIAPRVKLAEDVARAIVRQVPLTPDMDAVDFGCGTGLLSLALRPYVRSVTGVDSSQGMLEVFRRKIDRLQLRSVSAVYFDSNEGVSFSFSCHLIVSNMALHHIRDIPAVLKMFKEALLPGGYCAVADLDPEEGLFHGIHDASVFHKGFDHAQLQRMFADAGYTDIRCCKAAEVGKPLEDGSLKQFSVFLMTARA